MSFYLLKMLSFGIFLFFRCCCCPTCFARFTRVDNSNLLVARVRRWKLKRNKINTFFVRKTNDDKWMTWSTLIEAAENELRAAKRKGAKSKSEKHSKSIRKIPESLWQNVMWHKEHDRKKQKDINFLTAIDCFTSLSYKKKKNFFKMNRLIACASVTFLSKECDPWIMQKKKKNVWKWIESAKRWIKFKCKCFSKNNFTERQWEDAENRLKRLRPQSHFCVMHVRVWSVNGNRSSGGCGRQGKSVAEGQKSESCAVWCLADDWNIEIEKPSKEEDEWSRTRQRWWWSTRAQVTLLYLDRKKAVALLLTDSWMQSFG